MGKGHFITVSSTVLYLTSPKLERAIRTLQKLRPQNVHYPVDMTHNHDSFSTIVV